jgi:mannose-6-phosphate isomerase-like protein (cupin superfamily)
MNQVIDTNEVKLAHSESWFAMPLTVHNGVALRYRVIRDTSANFHTHEQTPECFFVLTGEVSIDTEEGSVSLSPGQFFRVKPGVSHRARVVGEATLLVFDAIEPKAP